MRWLRPLVALATFTVSAAGQEPPAQPPAVTGALTVFLDCQNVYCDFDFMRTDITAVNWVRDQAPADVHILMTGQDTGAGGREFTATFIGRRQFAGLADTLKYVAPPNFTDDERRKGMSRIIKAGLVRFVARTTAGEKMTVSFGEVGAASTQTSTKADPWKAWVFNLRLGGWGGGEETYLYYNVNGNLEANRITEKWKTQFSVSQRYSQDEFEIDDTTTAINIRRNYSSRFLQVRSLNAHWSAGLRGDFSSSTYENTKVAVRMSPALEYNVFPYSQSTRRQLRFEYGLGIADNTYQDTTIYDKVHETLPLQRLQMQISARQPWGQVDMSATWTQYLHDATKYRIGSFVCASYRVFKGFNLNGCGGYDRIYDQFSLAKKNYTQQEILLRQFQRGTTYSYWLDFGVSYTFGSIFNNVVNPRFD